MQFYSKEMPNPPLEISYKEIQKELNATLGFISLQENLFLATTFSNDYIFFVQVVAKSVVVAK